MGRFAKHVLTRYVRKSSKDENEELKFDSMCVVAKMYLCMGEWIRPFLFFSNPMEREGNR